jgi:hypothetical protein
MERTVRCVVVKKEISLNRESGCGSGIILDPDFS